MFEHFFMFNLLCIACISVYCDDDLTHRTDQIWDMPSVPKHLLTLAVNKSPKSPRFLHPLTAVPKIFRNPSTSSMYTSRHLGNISHPRVYCQQEISYIKSRTPFRQYNDEFQKRYKNDYSLKTLQQNSLSQSNDRPFMSDYYIPRKKLSYISGCKMNNLHTSGRLTKISNIYKGRDDSSGINQTRKVPFRSRFLKSIESSQGRKSFIQRARLLHLGVGQYSHPSEDVVSTVFSDLITETSKKKLFTHIVDTDSLQFRGKTVIYPQMSMESSTPDSYRGVNLPTIDGADIIHLSSDNSNPDTTVSDRALEKEIPYCSRVHGDESQDIFSTDPPAKNQESQNNDVVCSASSDSCLSSSQYTVLEPLVYEDRIGERSSHSDNASRKYLDDVINSPSQYREVRQSSVSNSSVEGRTPKDQSQTRTLRTDNTINDPVTDQQCSILDHDEEVSLPYVWDGCPVVLNHLKSVTALDGDTITLKCKVIGNPNIHITNFSISN